MSTDEKTLISILAVFVISVGLAAGCAPKKPAHPAVFQYVIDDKQIPNCVRNVRSDGKKILADIDPACWQLKVSE